GGHVARCEDCPHALIAYNSCRNRHCPKCQGSAARAWLADREAELLSVPYYHIVFTLPGPIADLAYQNKEVMYDILFKASAETMLTIAADPKHLGARIGITSVLHTWGSAMTHHPHVHMIVPGGGISLDGTRWIGCRPKYLLPVKVLSRLFRRLKLEMLLAAHDAGRLQFFGDHAHLADKTAFKAYLAPLHRTKWFVYSKWPFAGPEQVLAYLSRYTHRVAISNSRLIAADATGVTFRYKDYRIKGPGRYKTMTLKPDEFIRRFLMHVLPNGFHRIRHYGLLASGTKAATIVRARELIAAAAPAQTAHQPQPPDSAARRHNTDRRRQPRSGSIHHDHVLHVTDSKCRSFSRVVDPPRRRSRKSTLTISTCAPIFIAQGGHLRSQRNVHARHFIAQGGHLRPQRPVHARQRRRPTHSWVSAAISQVVCRAQIPIAPAARPPATSRGFVH